ncbi:MAG: hypothetical protein ABIH25_01455 [Candidatus Woesearchaeota archaeon]
MAAKEIGKISHYFDKISVAVIDLKGTLKAGDKITIGDGEDAFEQKVSSMQVEHKKIASAKKGDSVGLKVDKPVKVNWKVCK